MLLHLGTMRFFDPSRLPESITYISGFGVLESEGLAGLVTLLRREIAAHRATTAGLPILIGAVVLLVAGLPGRRQRDAGWRDRPWLIGAAGLLGALLAGVLSGPSASWADDKPVGPGAKPPPSAYPHPVRDPAPVSAAIDREIDRQLHHARWAPRVNISARTGRHVDRLVPALETALDGWGERVPTARLNAFAISDICSPRRHRVQTSARSAADSFVHALFLIATPPKQSVLHRHVETTGCANTSPRDGLPASLGRALSGARSPPAMMRPDFGNQANRAALSINVRGRESRRVGNPRRA